MLFGLSKFALLGNAVGNLSRQIASLTDEWLWREMFFVTDHLNLAQQLDAFGGNVFSLLLVAIEFVAISSFF